MICWFIRRVRLHLQYPFNVLRVDHAGELYNNIAFREALAKIHCHVETTGGYSSHANGRAERSIGLLGTTTQCLLYGGGRDVTFWCYAITHACLLQGLRTSHDGMTTHERFFGVKPSLERLSVWNSRVYCVDRRPTRNRPDSYTRKGYFLGYLGCMHVITYLSDTGKVLGARNVEIDELQLDLPIKNRSPYAQFLSNQENVDINHKQDLQKAISELIPDSSPWINAKLAQHFIEYISINREFGMEYEYDHDHGRCCVTYLVPESIAKRHLPRNAIGMFILSINGQSVRTPDEVHGAIKSFIVLSNEFASRRATGITPKSTNEYAASLNGMSLLLAKKDRRVTDIADRLDLNQYDLAMARMVWAIGMLGHSTATELTVPTTMGKTRERLLPDTHIQGIKHVVANIESVGDDYLSTLVAMGINSISGSSDPVLKCPPNWRAALKSPDKLKWLKALYDHLEKCYHNGTYGIPRTPPPGVSVIPPVIVLKHLLNVVKQMDERKIRVCCNGSKQIQGIDYEESFASALLAITMSLFFAVVGSLAMDVYHLDISNCFQSTPDEKGTKLWMGPIFPEWIDMLRERLPNEYRIFTSTFGDDLGQWPSNLAVEMYNVVQGRKDASLEWDILARRILKSVGVVATCGDPSLFSGVLQPKGNEDVAKKVHMNLSTPEHDRAVLIMKATDDFGIGTRKKASYLFLVELFRKWKFVVHDIGEMSFYFGARIIISSSCISMDHNHMIEQSLVMMFGPRWNTQTITTKTAPLPSTTEFESRLFLATPFSLPEKIKYEASLGWAYRTILGIWIFVAHRSRIDILTAVTLLSQFQNAPGKVHYNAMMQVGKWLRCHPDIPLTFKRNTQKCSDTKGDKKAAIQVNSIEVSFEECNDIGIHSSSVNSIEATRFNKECLLLQKDDGDDMITPHYSDIYTNEDLHVLDTTESAVEINAVGMEGLDVHPPYMEAGVDANFNGGLAERRSMMGGYITMNGTVIFAFCKKILVFIGNATEGEIHGAYYMGKNIMWIRQIMEDLGIPFQAPTPCAEDNKATQLAANAGKVQKQARHIAVKQAGLQDITSQGEVHYYLVKGASQHADILTKLVPHDAVLRHANELNGSKFITREHMESIIARNNLKMGD